MDKPALRAELLANRRKRTALETAAERSQRGSLIADRCLRLEQVVQACARGDLITSYEALPSEPPTAALNEALTAVGAQVAIPVHAIDGDALDDMQWRDLVTGQLVASTSDELVARGVAVIFTPALAVGRDGSRLGKGKGYYDKFFSRVPQFPAGPLRVGIVEPTSVFDSLPTDEHDQPVDTFVVG